MNYLSVCSGIEAASVAWADFDWNPIAFSEIEPFPSAVLKSRFPSVKNLGDRECERLQGFPDDWTLVHYRGKPACDGPRYKAIGNSMAVPVMRWIGERIDLVDTLKGASK
jgi:site-specific DNA-cytosine methylase